MSRKQVRPGRFPLACLEIERPPEVHYDAYERSGCDCRLCQEWLLRSNTYVMAVRKTVGHPRSCMCEACDDVRTASIALLVVENIRDLWSELSWAAAQERWGPEWMIWAYEELADPSRSPGWWASQLTHLPMSFWYLRWRVWKGRRQKETE
jgi:hypothetical protein